MTSYDVHFMRVRDYILKRVLGKYMMKHKTKHYYPVVVGGTNINRCLGSSSHTRKLLDSMFASDVDLDFVIVDDKVPINVIHERRMRFMNDIVNDPGLKAYLERVGRGRLKLRLDDKTIHMTHLRVSKMMLVTMKLEWYDETDRSRLLQSSTIMDCPLYHKGNVDDFRLYARFFPGLKLPIPYVTENGVMFATCGYIYYDTVRMMLYYSKELEKGKSENREFNYKKLVRYVTKFSALYLLINKLQKDVDSNYRNIIGVYEAAKKLLDDIDPSRDGEVFGLIAKLTRSTNLKELQMRVASDDV